METEFYLPLLDLGFFGIVVLAFAEKLIPVLPSYFMLVFLGATQASSLAGLTMLTSATACGSLLGAIFWYSVGRISGRENVEMLVARYGGYVFLPEIRYRQLAKAYADHQFWTTLIAQTIPTLRIFLAVPAGVLKLDLMSFIPATGLGILVWNTPLISVGYMMRDAQLHLLSLGLRVIVVLLLAEIAIVLSVHGFRHLQRRRMNSGVKHAHIDR
jgi:membrane protein DedA with SNARE-associated domain